MSETETNDIGSDCPDCGAPANWDELIVQLAKDILSLADSAGMPDSYKQTDSRMERARDAVEKYEYDRG